MSTKLLGDPHLGRQFIHGVPLAKRGTREEMVWSQFSDHVSKCKGIDYHICMGDLFDKAVVPYRVILRAALIYMNAAMYWPNCTFIILKGNHDWMRDLELPSAFDIFAKIVEQHKNIVIVDKPLRLDGMMFFAWHPVLTFDQLEIDPRNKITTAYGHWDIQSYGGPDNNLIPTKGLADLGFKEVYNGHIHRPQGFTRDEIQVHVVGSMQPYAHGEEIDESLYVTRKISDLGDVGAYRDKCLRIITRGNELLDYEPIDCLQLTIKRELEQENEQPVAVTLGDFDVEALFLQSLSEGKVSKSTTEKLLNIFQSKRLVDGT